MNESTGALALPVIRAWSARAFSESAPAMALLRARGYRMGILSHVPWPGDACRAWFERHGLSGFIDFLIARDDRMLILSTGHSTGFDFVVKVKGQRIHLTNPPEDLVFREG